MQNYDFLVLSPYEFENVSRDLLQKKLGVFLESFTSGRDNGIDLRSCKVKNDTLIIQAKRYSEYSSLLSNLKKEIPKVEKLKPTRYIITTTVGLTPPNKDEIKSLFEPYIINTEDIIGKDDLNNLLGLYKDIELKYYKLWLTSTVVLDRVIHSKIYNQSAFELEEIKNQLGLYVQNNSFRDAINILNENKYVIISGIPGIGKTTLSRVLIFALLSQEIEEFIYLADDIDDAYTFFSEGKKQVFFFDDFLGRNIFDPSQQINKDTKIVKLIEKIKRTNDKFLILATREYILRQAKQVYESFSLHNIELAKCTLDLSTYTNVIKAQILYNHLSYHNVPFEYVLNLMEGKRYLRLIRHKNYNPRIIETIINRKIWQHIDKNQFGDALISFFDNPESVWLYAFENLSRFSQYTLLSLLTTGGPILIEDLEEYVKEFLKINSFKYLVPFDSIIFNRTLRELEDTFIRTQKDSKDKYAIEFQNPSIQDFLVGYLRGKTDLIDSLLNSFIFKEQFFNVFTNDTNNENIKRLILLDIRQIELAAKRLVSTFKELKSSRIFRINQGEKKELVWLRYASDGYQYLLKVLDSFPNLTTIKELIYQELSENLYLDSYFYLEQDAYIKLLSKVDMTKVSIDKAQALKSLISHLGYVKNLKVFSNVKDVFPDEYEKVTADQSFQETLNKVIKDEIQSVKNDDISSLIKEIQDVENTYNTQYEPELEELQKRDTDYQTQLDKQIESHLDNPVNDEQINSHFEEERIITEMFNSFNQ